MQVFTCRTLRIEWGSRVQVVALGVVAVCSLALLGELAAWQFWVALGSVVAVVWFIPARRRSVRRHVLELARESIWIHPGEGRRRPYRLRLVITSRSVADGYLLAPSRLVLTRRDRTTLPGVAYPAVIPALISRIEERRAAAALASAPALGVLDRGGRPVGEWRAALSELALGAKAFRGAALPDDALQRILDDPGAPLEQRIGAALALRSRGGDAQGRIRVAAATSVEPRVRVALEAAAADEMDDRAIGRALDKPEPARSAVARDEPDEGRS